MLVKATEDGCQLSTSMEVSTMPWAIVCVRRITPLSALIITNVAGSSSTSKQLLLDPQAMSMTMFACCTCLRRSAFTEPHFKSRMGHHTAIPTSLEEILCRVSTAQLTLSNVRPVARNTPVTELHTVRGDAVDTSQTTAFPPSSTEARRCPQDSAVP